ncbi:MAG: hypothetical protein HYV60_03140, partial [Planctomycetia bacterium]|nr:hypothetical protein [Planctomycetia bacterium]
MSRLTRSLTLLGLLSLFAMTATASAQVADDGAHNRIDFPVADELEPAAPQELDLERNLTDHPGTYSIWEHDAGQCCGDCPPAWRVRADALSLDYAGGSGVTLSNAFALDDFDYELGGRISVVRHLDCLDAWELAYVGAFEWNEFGQVNGVGLTSRLSSATVNLSEFNNATFHSQAYRTKLNSVEANRRWYGWDVISTLAGIRYLDVDENYLFNSTGAGGAGSLEIQTKNEMIGPQIGLELMYPLGNWMTTTSLKGALMGNSTDGRVRLVNAGTVEVANADDNLELATLIELGYYLTYQITPRVKFRGGYEFWWLYGFATVPGQLSNPITAQTGSHVDGNSDV